MSQKNTLPIPGKSLAYVGVCLGGVLVFIFLSILPTNKAIKRVEREINLTQDQIKEQEALYPVYTELMQKLQADDPMALPFPEEVPLARINVNNLAAIFGEMATSNKLEVITIVPDFKTIARDSSQLMVEASFGGDLFNFREFLVALGGTPHLRKIEEIDIITAPDSKTFNLKFWLALES